MSSPMDDDERAVLEIQFRRLARENAALKQIETSKAYRFAKRLRGAGSGSGRVGNYLRAFELGLRLVAERFGIGVEDRARVSSARRAKARWRLRQIAARMPNGDDLLALSRKPPPEGVVRVLVMGVGGLGDALSTMVVAAALKRVLSPCEIYLVHLSATARELANPYVTDAWTISPADFPRLQKSLALLDVFDLIVDHCYCVRYIETASVQIEPRLPPGHLLAAASALRPFAEAVFCQPLHNNLLGREAARAGLSAFDIAGITGALNIDSGSPIPLFMTAESYSIFARIDGLRHQSYVTLHNGVNNREARAGPAGDPAARPVKLLPPEAWPQIVAELKRAGLMVVQLGEVEDYPVEGVDCDLRGQTSLLEGAAVLKQAACHVDTEGGLVHLARAVYCPSVVAFGPTPVRFFGYRQNINLPPPRCGDCWWITTDWLTRCPRGTAGPECMAAHSARQIAEQALSLIAARRKPTFEMHSSRLLAPSDALVACIQREAEAAGLDQASIAWIGARTALKDAFGAAAPRMDIFDVGLGTRHDARSSDHTFAGRTLLGSIYNLPAETEAYDAVGFHATTYDGSCRRYAVQELARIVRPGGLVCMTYEIASTGSDGPSDAVRDLPLVRALLDEFGLGADDGPDKSAQDLGVVDGSPRGITIGAVVLRRLR